MRPLEIILVLILLALVMAPLIRMERWLNWISVTALGVMGLHLIFEGYRWQMFPLYGIALGLGIFTIWRFIYTKTEFEETSTHTIARTGSLLLLLFIAVIPPILLPIPRTPEPTGPYPVGTTTIMLVDESREELYSEKVGESRQIMVQIWYPAETVHSAKEAPWLDNMDVMGPALSKKLNLPSFFLDHVKYSHSHALIDVPISSQEAQYPLLLLSHGWGGFRAQNTYQVEELASHGYVVAAPDHAYGAIASVFPDGSVALNNHEALPVDMGLSEEEYLAAAQVLGAQWAGDLSFILDILENVKPTEPAGHLANRLDFFQVGTMGHSTGGGAALQFCTNDERCKAFLGMDPYMDPAGNIVLEEGVSQPYLAIFSASWKNDRSRNNDIFNHFIRKSTGQGYRYYIEKTAHYDFTDMPAFSPLAPYLGLKGPLAGEQVSKIINAYTLAFFGRHLKGEIGALLDQPSAEFPEMIYWP